MNLNGIEMFIEKDSEKVRKQKSFLPLMLADTVARINKIFQINIGNIYKYH